MNEVQIFHNADFGEIRTIEEGVYPFGLCIKTDGSAVYQIFKRLLDEWIAERGVEA